MVAAAYEIKILHICEHWKDEPEKHPNGYMGVEKNTIVVMCDECKKKKAHLVKYVTFDVIPNENIRVDTKEKNEI